MITGDFIMKKTNRVSMTSGDVYEQKSLDELYKLNLTQIRDCFTTKRYTLGLVFVNNLDLFIISSFSQNFAVCLPSTRHDYQSSPKMSTVYVFDRCDDDMLNALIIEQPFTPKCYSNSDQTDGEWFA